jgi:hypothetical protein
MTNHDEILGNEEELSQEFIDSLFEKGPEITTEQMYQIEKNMSDKNRGIARRVSLAVLTKSIKELYEIGEEDSEIYAEMLEQVTWHFENAKAALDLAQAAHMRMLIADCHVKAVAEATQKT